jgi:hypothetical protein
VVSGQQLGRLPRVLAAWEAALVGPQGLPLSPLEVAEAVRLVLLAREASVPVAYRAAAAVAEALEEVERRRANGEA